MLPYLNFQFLELGLLKIYTWGIFVSFGFLISLLVLVKKYPSDKNIFIDLWLYILLGSLVGARLFYTFFYAPDVGAALGDIYKIWRGGMSSFGGFFGGAAAFFLYCRYRKLRFYDLAQKLAFVLPLGLAIGRIGCGLINDHPGIRTIALPFSVRYPDGIRFDLGWMLAIFNAAIFIFFLLKKKAKFLENFLIIYGAGRFFLDFLRIGEPTYFYLLPSQYGSLIFFFLGIYLIKVKSQN